MVDRMLRWLSRFQPLSTCTVASFTLKWEWYLRLCYGANGAKIPTTVIILHRTVSLQTEGEAGDGNVRGCREQVEIFSLADSQEENGSLSAIYREQILPDQFLLKLFLWFQMELASVTAVKEAPEGNADHSMGTLTPQRNQFCPIQILDPKKTEGNKWVCSVAINRVVHFS